MSQLLFDWGNKMFQEVSLFQRSVVDFRFFSGRNIRSLMLLLLADGVVADFIFFYWLLLLLFIFLFVAGQVGFTAYQPDLLASLRWRCCNVSQCLSALSCQPQ